MFQIYLCSLYCPKSSNYAKQSAPRATIQVSVPEPPMIALLFNIIWEFPFLSYAVGDVCALVPPRKAVWSLPGMSNATGKTFFLLLFYVFIDLTHIFFFSPHFYSTFVYLVYYYIFFLAVFILLFHLLCVTT